MMIRNSRQNNTFSTTSILIVILILLSTWTLFFKLGAPNFYDIRLESRRAEIARNMLETGNWIVPQLAGEPILTKPPIYFWAVVLCSIKTGVNEFTARMPSAIFGIATVIVTFFLGFNLFNRTVGVYSALALLVTNIFIDQSRYAEMESMLVFFITSSIYFFFKGYQIPKHEKLWFALFFTMIGLGTMTKGPFAFTFPLIPIVLYLFIYKEQGLLVKKTFLSGLKFFFIILLPWLGVILWLFPKFVLIFLWETIAYYAEGYGHRNPFYFYFIVVGPTLFPWIFFLPFSLWIAFSERLKNLRKENVFLILWLFGNILFLSFSKAKRDFYLTPLAPAVALLIGSTWESLWEWGGEKLHYDEIILQRIFFIIGTALAGLAFLAGNPFSLNFPSKRFPHIPTFFLFMGLSFMSISLIKRLLPNISVAKTALATIVILVFASQYLYLTYTIPIKNTYDSGANFYKALPNLIKPEVPLATFVTYANYAFSFYSHRPVIYLTKKDEVNFFMAAHEKRYLVMAESYLTKFPDVPWKIIYKSSYSEHEAWGSYLLLCNH